MPNIDFGPFIQSVAIALVLFAIGRFIAIQMEEFGRWMIYAGLIVFYLVWWVSYQRGKRKK
jgi:hypothetical protein